MLFLYNNQLVSLKSIENLTRLTTLELALNRIDSLEGIENLTKLTWLSLSSNQIDSIKSIENLTELEILYLYNNQIVSIEGFEKLTNLTTLDLSNNKIVKIQALENLTELTTLDLSNNQMESVQGVEKLTKLTSLDLSNNNLITIQGIEYLIKLISLDLRFNKIYDIKFNRILNNNTKFLMLVNNDFQKIRNYSLINFQSIKMINFDNNQITDVEPMAFFSLNNLTHLSLKNNSIKIICNHYFFNLIQFDISGNNVSFITEISFKQVSSLNLDYSSLHTLENIDYTYFNVQFLHLDNQKIEKLFKNTIKGLFSKLDLSSNLLTSVSFEVDALDYLPNLNEILFSKNLIKSLDFNEAFKFNMTKTKLLNFENNKISSIKKDFFSKFSNLTVLLLSYNYFGSLKNYFFENLEKLEYLNLSNNQILTIEDGTFENLSSLIYLNLTNNLIYDLSQRLFSNLSRLEILELRQNKLESIEKHFLDGLASLKYLDLSQNQIKFLNNNSFQAVINLEELYMQSNLLSYLNDSLKNLKNLSNLDLSNNKLDSFKRGEVIANLTSLDLSFNQLERFDHNQSNLFSLKSLKLSNTDSSVISNINFELFSKLEELDLSDNFNINMTKGIDKLIKLRKLNLKNINSIDCSFINNLKELEEINVGGNKNYYFCLRDVSLHLKSLSISNISLREIILQAQNLIYLDISYNNISSMFGLNNFTNLHYLDLKFNFIEDILMTSFINFNFHRFSELEYINLNRSLTKSLSNFELKFGKKLENAVLSSNNLRIFPKFCKQDGSQQTIAFSCNLKMFYFEYKNVKLEVLDLSYNKIHSIKDESFKGLINLRDLYLNGNEPDLKIENSSFRRFESIKTIYIDKPILSNSKHKSIFIDMVKNKNYIHNKTILKWIYYSAFNLITLNESFYDCGLVFELIRYNIQYNLKTEADFTDYLENCQPSKMERKDSNDHILEKNEIINFIFSS